MPGIQPSNAALSFHASLALKRSAANPYGTSGLQLKTAHLKPKPSFDQKGSQSRQHSPIHNLASLKKTTFQWVKGELLGKGSYAQVFLALNATTGEVMAVKQVEIPEALSDRSNSRLLDIMQAIKFESNTLKDLDHANIVQYLGYEESPQYLSIFLEYVPGGTISSCLKKYGRFSQEVTKSFTSQILAGLEYLHSEGILHRDLKADNILVEPTGVCKISDFGISKKADIHHGRAFTGMKGTVFWMAPEILSSGGKGYDVKVDIWSVGCIVLEMWTGDRPWSGEELLPVMMKLFEHKLPPPVPRDLILCEDALNFRSQCFQRNPQDRPSAAELQKHPYLTLPSGWRFELTDMQHPRRSLSMASNRSRKSMKVPRQPKPASGPQQHIPPVPPMPVITSSGYPGLPSDTQRNSSMLHRPRPDQDHGPQLVFITPPGSPVRDNSRTDHVNEPSGSQKLIGFYVVNADPEPNPDQTTFIYCPPPLPGVDPKSPYSARLAPLSQHHVPYAPATGRSVQTHSTHSATGQPSSRVVEKQAESSQKEGDGYDSDDSDAGTSLWNRPPVDLTAGRLNDGPEPLVSSRSSQIKKAIYHASTHHEHGVPWAPRPAPEEVYDHLQEFFPHHDLDKAIIEVGQVDSTRDKRRRAKKSIRMVAEEQINRSQRGIRRKTKLWDSNVKELRM